MMQTRLKLAAFIPSNTLAIWQRSFLVIFVSKNNSHVIWRIVDVASVVVIMSYHYDSVEKVGEILFTRWGCGIFT